jgi:hypothetical protein
MNISYDFGELTSNPNEKNYDPKLDPNISNLIAFKIPFHFLPYEEQYIQLYQFCLKILITTPFNMFPLPIKCDRNEKGSDYLLTILLDCPQVHSFTSLLRLGSILSLYIVHNPIIIETWCHQFARLLEFLLLNPSYHIIMSSSNPFHHVYVRRNGFILLGELNVYESHLNQDGTDDYSLPSHQHLPHIHLFIDFMKNLFCHIFCLSRDHIVRPRSISNGTSDRDPEQEYDVIHLMIGSEINLYTTRRNNTVSMKKPVCLIDSSLQASSSYENQSENLNYTSMKYSCEILAIESDDKKSVTANYDLVDILSYDNERIPHDSHRHHQQARRHHQHATSKSNHQIAKIRAKKSGRIWIRISTEIFSFSQQKMMKETLGTVVRLQVTMPLATATITDQSVTELKINYILLLRTIVSVIAEESLVSLLSFRQICRLVA